MKICKMDKACKTCKSKTQVQLNKASTSTWLRLNVYGKISLIIC